MNADRILEDLYVGQKIDSESFRDELVRLGVTHVLNLFEPETIWEGNSLYLPQEDDGSPRVAAQVRCGLDYYAEVKAAKGVLYVHCQWGLGRAPAMCYALLRANGQREQEALDTVNACRRVAAKYNPHWQRYIPSIESALK
jgi:protein-tyrosine phosphatase